MYYVFYTEYDSFASEVKVNLLYTLFNIYLCS